MSTGEQVLKKKIVMNQELKTLINNLKAQQNPWNITRRENSDTIDDLTRRNQKPDTSGQLAKMKTTVDDYQRKSGVTDGVKDTKYDKNQGNITEMKSQKYGAILTASSSPHNNMYTILVLVLLRHYFEKWMWVCWYFVLH